MWKDWLPRERMALFGLSGLAAFAVVFAVVKGQRQPAPIIFQDVQPPAAAASVTTVVVHATGAVRNPGVLHLDGGARVEDAVKAAGGPAPDADLDDINLAAKLVDGTQVFVPHRNKTEEAGRIAEEYKGGEVSEAYAAQGRKPVASGGTAKREPAGGVNLNTGSQSELESLPGIGPSTAQKILEYRRAHGGFSSVDELMAVKGIGPKKLAAMRKFLKL